jgi:hypothetical protein
VQAERFIGQTGMNQMSQRLRGLPGSVEIIGGFRIPMCGACKSLGRARTKMAEWDLTNPSMTSPQV